MTEFVITLEQIFVLVGVAVAVLLVMTLLKVYEILKQVKTILLKNESNINQSLDSLPKVINNVDEITKGLNGEMKHIGGTIRNIEEITDGVNEEIKHLKGAVRNIEETVEYAAATAQSITEDVVLPIADILNLLSILKGVFVKEKKKGFFSK